MSQANMTVSSVVATIAPLLMMQHGSGGGLRDTLYRALLVLLMQAFMNLSELKASLRSLLMPKKKEAQQVVCLRNVSSYKDGCYASGEASEEARAVLYVLYKAAIDGRLSKHRFTMQQTIIGIKQNYVVHLESGEEVEFRTKCGSKVYLSCNHSESSGQSTTSSIGGVNSNSVTVKTYTLTIRPEANGSIEVAHSFIKECVERYNGEVLNNTVAHTIYVLKGFMQLSAGTVPQFKEVPFETTKSFDNMFFESKQSLMKRIMDFEKSEERYKRLGIPYTLGMMFHGSPGCGKTSCIKAIASLTGRHIVSVPLKTIKKIDDLNDLFTCKCLNNVNIPNRRRLYVFEEIDCGQWKKVVRSRKLVDDPIPVTSAEHSNTVVECMKMVTRAVAAKEHEPMVWPSEDKISLGDLLELLDGIVEMPGRMIVMTSNHPEHIDEALLRPGRIDMTMEFKRMSRADIAEMYGLWFGRDLPRNVFDKLKDYRFSQAEIGNIFSVEHPDDVHRALAKDT